MRPLNVDITEERQRGKSGSSRHKPHGNKMACTVACFMTSSFDVVNQLFHELAFEICQ